METVCADKHWDVLLVEEDGQVKGALPFLFGKKCGLKYILQPQLTQFNGPWLSPEMNFDERVKVMSDLVGQLEGLHLALYMQCFPSEETNWLPFYWKGYRQTTHYTYRFDPLRPVVELMEQAQPQRRKRMDLLRRECLLDRQVGPNEFSAFHNEYYLRKSGHNLLSPNLVERVCSTALERGNALLYGLRDSQGNLQVADFVVFDSRCAHSLMSGMAPNALRNSTTLLFWHLIDDLYGRTAAFDFEGSMDPGIEQFFRSFGATQTPYHCVYRSRIPFGKFILGI
ncbi:MAG: hypothetical protein IKS44_07735 [Bacteroidales bacterium]|nr:hypothetical protein [Bacteroidales bacterium]